MNRLFVVFLLSLVSLQVFAETKTYDFSTRTAGVDAFAYQGEANNGNTPPSSSSTPSFQLNASEYGGIESSDQFADFYYVNQNGRKAIHRFVFNLDESAATISQLDILWQGSGVNYARNRDDGVELYIWNFNTGSSGAYELISSTSSSNQVILTDQITSNLADYVSNNASNQIILLVASRDTKRNRNDSFIYTNYIKVDVTSTPVNPAPFTCDVGDSYSLTASDNFSSTLSNWQATNFNRNISNWPGESIYNTSGQEQNIVYTINNDLSIDGANEYGMVEYDLVDDNIDATAAQNYSIYTDLDTNSGSTTNNDAGIVFGYQDDANYYLARWTAFGTTYQSSSSYPGTYRSFDLIKVSGGVATELDSRVMDLGDRTSIMVVATDDGVGICTGSYGAAKADMQVALFTTETVPLHSLGLYSYDNDIGIDYDNFELRCQDCDTINTEPLAHYQFEQDDFLSGITDSTGNNNGATNIGGSVTLDGKYCRAFDSNGTNTTNVTDNAFRSSLDLVDDVGVKGSISFWFNSNTDWNAGGYSGGERVLFDATEALNNNSSDKYFALEIQQDGRLRFSFEDSDDGDFSLQESSLTVRDADTWYYVTVTWDYTNNNFAIYVDDSQVASSTSSTNGAMRDLDNIVFGDNSSTYTANSNGSLPSDYSANGKFDEIRIYNRVIDIDRIREDMQGTDCAQLISNWQMEEFIWDGTSGEVIDQTGNFNLTSFNGANTLGTSPALAGNPGTCRYGEFDGINDYLEISDDPALDLQDQLSITAWIRPSSLPSADFKTILSKDENYEFHITPAGEVLWWWNSDELSTTGANISAGNWYHIAITYKSGEQKIYVNGVERGSHNYEGQLTLNDDPLQVGQDQNYPGRYFAGNIDEVRIYDGALLATEVDTIYRETHPCVEEPELIANYQMEQQSWDGTAGEIIDETGNYNATAINGATTESSSPALTGNPGTCRYGEFDGTDDYVQLPDSFENLTDSFTITAWINPRNQDRGQRILADDESNTRGYAFSLGDPGNGRLRFYSRGVSPISVDTQSAVISTNTWTFVTAVHNAETKTREIYVNGFRQELRDDHSNTGQALTYSGNWGTDSGFASIGGETNRGETANRFTGNIDEVRVYKGALTSDQINVVYRETHPCEDNFELFKIEHDSQGLTCQSEPVTITACTDATCNSIDSSVNTSVVLSLGNGDTQTVSIVNGEGTAATSSFNYTDTATPAELSLTSDFLCSNTSSGTTGTSGEPCQVNFATTGFVFSNIGDQTSGEDFPSITIQALADEGGVCTALVSDTTTIQMAMQYQIPTTPTANVYDIGGTTIAAQSGAPTSYSNVSLNFDNTGTAVLPTNRYDDAGRINLHARFVVPASGNNPAVTVVGSSNLFWVIPAAINIDSNKIDSSASDRSFEKFPAGDSFDFSLTAVNALGGTTYNYIPNDVEISVQRLLPSAAAVGSVDGSFNYGSGAIASNTNVNFVNASSASFTNGEYATSSAFFDEVGVIAIDARENNYGGTGEVIDAVSIRLNRFTPKYFTQEVAEHGTVVGEGACSDWHYSGKPGISYGDIPKLTISAFNSKGNITANYQNFATGGSFRKLVKEDVVITEPIEDLKMGAIVNTKLALSASITAKSEPFTMTSAGIYEYALNSLDSFTYTRNANAVMPPFTAEFDMVIDSIEDSDGVSASSKENIEIRSDVEIRFGRLVLENSFGPETDDIPQPVRTEYLTSITPISYQTHQEDNCTAIGNTATNWSFANNTGAVEASEVSIQGGAGNMAAGEYSGVLLRSDDGKIGSVTVTYATPAWLKFDWDGDGNYDNDAEAVVTFGRFRGNDRIIYWQEIAN